MLVSALAFAVPCMAQPTLNLKRLVSHWPEVDLYFSIQCNGQAILPFGSFNFDVFEDGAAVNNWSLWFPKSPQPNIRTAAVVLQCTKTGTQGLAAAIGAALHYIGDMDGKIDDACVLSVDYGVQLIQTVTTSKTLLTSAIAGINWSTGNRTLDACHAGVSEVIRAGCNPVRAVILLTDGDDKFSVHTPAEITALANANHIRIFAIRIGTVAPGGVHEQMALATGGRFYNTTTMAETAAACDDIAALMRRGCDESRITYQALCMDGTSRKVDLALKELCNGTDTKTLSYTAPKDTSSYSDCYIRCGTTTSPGNRAITVPVLLDTPLDNFRFGYSQFEIRIDNPAAKLSFQKIEAPAGSLLEGVPMSVTVAGRVITVQTTQRKIVTGPGLLAELTFVAPFTPDSVCSDIRLTSWSFEHGCLRAALTDGRICLTPNLVEPVITASGPTDICTGDSLVLTTNPVFRSYSWSPDGEVSRFIVVRQSGTYSVTCVNNDGLLLTSNPVDVVVHQRNPVSITASGPLSFCEGKSVTLVADAVFASVRWSTGEITRAITAVSTGTYRVTILNDVGCPSSDSVLVTVTPLLPVVTASGPTTICAGDSVTLTAEAGHAVYRWSTGAATREIIVRSGGIYTVRVTDGDGCTGVSGISTVTVVPRPATPAITRSGDELTAPPALRWQWYKDGAPIPGATGRTITAQDNGRYAVEVWDADDGCGAISDALDVIVNVESLPTARDIAVYPDPHDGVFTLAVPLRRPGAVQVRVTDVLGRTVYDRTLWASTADFRVAIDIATAPAGLYFLRITTERDVVVRAVRRR